VQAQLAKEVLAVVFNRARRGTQQSTMSNTWVARLAWNCISGAPVWLPVISREKSDGFSQVDMDLLSNFANTITSAIHNAQLHSEIENLAVTDWLTNIHNRRGFFALAHKGLEYARQDRRSLSALLMDLDHFKSVNDRYGHAAGDEVIRAVADVCRLTLRETDLLGRYGGEEFVVLLPDSDENIAWEVAERLRGNIAQMRVMSAAGTIAITVSIGIAQYNPPYAGLDTLLQRADEALYSAKASGRNKVICWKGDQVAFQNYQSSSFIIPGENALLPLVDGMAELEPVEKIYDDVIQTWMHALEMRDKETKGHTERVAGMTLELARRMGVAGNRLNAV
jgi:diguanylate cyclase (GGDEF)-like protein